MSVRSLLPLLCSVVLGTGAMSPLHAVEFYTLQTGSMRLVYYSPEHAFIVPHLVRSFENSMSFHSKLFHYTPSEPVLLFLQDYDDYGYAGATSLPHNYMILGIEPYEYAYETSPTNERINWVISHELMHVVASDPASGGDSFFRSFFFGKVLPTDEDPPSMLYSYWTSPRKYAPRWYHEGIATFMETWMAGGIGRAQNGYDEMVFRTMVRDNDYFYDYVGLESEGTTVDFQIGANSYLYGTRFVSYLAHRYSPENVLTWFSRNDTSDASFSGQFERVFERPLDDVWGEWVGWEHRWQQAMLDTIREYPLTPLRPVGSEPLGAVSRAHYDEASQMVYVGMNRPGSIAHIAAVRLQDGERTRVCDVPTPSLYNVASTAYDASTHTFFFTTKNSKGWRDLNAVDVRSGEVRVLLKEARIGDLTFNDADRSLWGVQHNNGISQIVRIPYPYAHWQEILPLKYGVDLYDLDMAPDGSALVAAMMRINGSQALIRISIDSLLLGGTDYDVLYEFENTAPLNFVHSRDGRFLYGSTYYTGVANLVRYNVASEQMEWLTNCETGLFRPVPLSEDSVLAFQYLPDGFQPVVVGVRPVEDVNPVQFLGTAIADNYPVVRSWKLGPPSPARIDVDSLTISSGDYEGIWAMGLTSAYPVLHGYKKTVALGTRLNFLDPLLLHALDVRLLYTPNAILPPNERFHAMAHYEYWGWDFQGTYNVSDFYDLFGPTKRSRKGGSLSAGYRSSIIDDQPSTLGYSLRAAAFINLERLPAFQNVATSARSFGTATARLNFSRRLSSLGGVDHEKGITWTLNAHTYYARTTFFPLTWGTFDWGFPLFADHSALWIRTAAGYGFGDPAEPFSNFYFGGFGNNWVDHQSIRRYRDFESFPGVELNAIGGTDFLKALVEWNPPPLRFRRLGFPALYCTWARLAVFSSGLVTGMTDEAFRTEAVNLGAQVDFKLVIFSNLSTTFSVGYARAAARGYDSSDEFMISLRIL
ncbi:MAG: hypothetical protein AMS21_04830 [Gemmatimonas sp. SG8_38_2]|nr:MAG: hypothetical protein AMS21_04830 [Gemmatimonas sp. SG8_38_2]